MPNISPEMKLDSVSSAHVYRHHAGYCNTVSSVQFGERIAIIYENEGLKEITCSAEIDAEWIKSFPVMICMSGTKDSHFIEEIVGKFTTTKHKEEGSKR